ncbi:MAG: nucleoid-associated protein [Sphingobacteriales bacterium]|nr:MAG: nucleoid-associated protein [Sphingobacteriales bacterium]
MPDFAQLTFKKLAIHRVGNKLRSEGVLSAAETYPLSDEHLRNTLLDYFLPPFTRYNDYYKFTHNSNLNLNELFAFCRHIFEKNGEFLDESINIAKHLYNQSIHPQIKGGELFVAYFSDCMIEDELTDAIGIFKSEEKDTFFKTDEKENSILLHIEKGINLKRLDKGCMIFNTFQNDGYRVIIIDKLSKSDSEARYWKNDFLNIIRVEDNGLATELYLSMCNEFGEDTFGTEQGKSEQVLFMNKSLQYFSDHELFDVSDFADQIFEDKPEHAQRFREYKQRYESENNLLAGNDFVISQPMVKIMKRKFRSLIKLDTNIDIRLHSETTEKYIERGYDEDKQMSFYKIYFREEE